MTITEGRIAVVTGASSGIGEATARALAAADYRVALLARRADRIAALADELGNGTIAIAADVTDRDSLVAAADTVGSELGRAHVLVNNAGVMLLGPFDTAQRADYRQMIEVNLLGAITATEVFLDHLTSHGDTGADIVNISSVAGRTARAGNGVYAATKWGMNGWSEALRQELLPDVRVTLIEPGVVATELPDHITHADTRQAVGQLYDQAEVTAADVAEIIAFVLSRPRRLAINELLFRPASSNRPGPTTPRSDERSGRGQHVGSPGNPPDMAGASESTKRVKYVNMNWEAGDDGTDGSFSCLIVTEDDERHVCTPTPCAATALVALTQSSDVLLWDPVNRTLIVANLIGEFFQKDWTAGDARRAR